MDMDPVENAREVLAHVGAEDAAKWEWRHALLDEQRTTNDLLAKFLRALENSGNDAG